VPAIIRTQYSYDAGKTWTDVPAGGTLPSAPIVVVPPPVVIPAAATLTATPGPGSVRVDWTPNAGKTQSGVTSARSGFDTSTPPAGPWTNTKTGGTVRTDTFDKLKPGTPYVFTVKIFYSNGTSDTLTATATPLAVVGGAGTGPVAGGGTLPSNVTWSSGAYTEYDEARLAQLGAFRGMPMDHASMFPTRDEGVDGIANPWYIEKAGKAVPRIMIGMPMAPNGGSLADDLTPAIKVMIANHKADGRPLDVRLGWEFNLPGGEDRAFSVTDANLPQWRDRFKQYADLFLSGLGTNMCRIFFNPNGGPNQSGLSGSIERAYVEGYAQGAGPDEYDSWGAWTSDASVANHLNRDQGLEWWADFCTRHGIGLVIPEWGLWRADQQGGGDNPRYITEMRAFMDRKRALMLLDSYFDERGDYLRSDLLEQNPRAGAEYKRLWSARAAV
jgi:hypothetical protein